jgi:uncharacterized membrane protein HdeD (DUF308 family)
MAATTLRTNAARPIDPISRPVLGDASVPADFHFDDKDAAAMAWPAMQDLNRGRDRLMQESTLMQPSANIGRARLDRGWFVALGILLVVVGTISLLFPFLAALSLNIVVGATLLVAGAATLVHAWRLRGWRGSAVQALLGLLYSGGGVIFLTNPFAGILALTVMLGAFFAADGAARMMLAFRIRPQPAWWLFLVTGLLALVLGVMVLLGLPSGWSVAFLGIIVGINMIFTGVSFVCCTGKESRTGIRPLV